MYGLGTTFAVDCYVDGSGNVVGCGAVDPSQQVSTNPYAGWGSNTNVGTGSGTGGTGYQQPGGVDYTGTLGDKNNQSLGINPNGLLSIPNPLGFDPLDPLKDPLKNIALLIILGAAVFVIATR